MIDLNQAQPEQVRKGNQGSQIALKIPPGGDSSQSSKFGPGSKAKGARIAWADKLNVSESSISDQSALQGIIFLNEDCTIERVN